MTAMTSPADAALCRPLCTLPQGATAVVARIEAQGADDAIAARLEDLGFVPGEALRIIALGPFGGDPLVVQVGFTRFALRRSEAARILVAATATTAGA